MRPLLHHRSHKAGHIQNEGYLSITGHLYDMQKGVIDTKDVIYYLSFIFLFLFFTVRVVESGKWK